MPAAPVTLAEGDRLRVRIEQLTPQERNPTVRRVRVATSGEASWSQVPAALEAAASEVVSDYNRLTRIDNVPLPVMEEQAPAERRETRLFERGNMLTKTGVALTPGMPELFPRLGRQVRPTGCDGETVLRTRPAADRARRGQSLLGAALR